MTVKVGRDYRRGVTGDPRNCRDSVRRNTVPQRWRDSRVVRVPGPEDNRTSPESGICPGTLRQVKVCTTVSVTSVILELTVNTFPRKWDRFVFDP